MMFFVLFKRPEHVKPFLDYMKSKYKNINISFETEKDGQMPSNITNRLVINVSRKKYLLEFTRTSLVSYHLNINFD